MRPQTFFNATMGDLSRLIALAEGSEPCAYVTRPPADLATADIPPLDPRARPRDRRAWNPSPHLDAIRPFGSETAARAVARHHALELVAAHDAATARAAGVLFAMASPIFRGRKHTRDSYDATRRSMKAYFDDGPLDIAAACKWEDDHARSDPRWAGVRFDVDPHHLADDLVGLRGFIFVRTQAMFFARSTAMSEWSTSPVSFIQHAAERVLERAPNFEGNVHLKIAEALCRLSPAIMTMAAAATAIDADAQIAVPFAGGLLLGSCDILPTSIALSNEIRGLRTDKYLTYPLSIDAAGLWMERMSLPGALSWTALTFIGPRDMRDNHRAYIAAFGALTESSSLDQALSIAYHQISTASTQHLDFDADAVRKRLPHGRATAFVLKDLDRPALARLAMSAIREEVCRIRPLSRSKSGAPIKARDHDRDPMRRAQARLMAKRA